MRWIFVGALFWPTMVFAEIPVYVIYQAKQDLTIYSAPGWDFQRYNDAQRAGQNLPEKRGWVLAPPPGAARATLIHIPIRLDTLHAKKFQTIDGKDYVFGEVFRPDGTVVQGWMASSQIREADEKYIDQGVNDREELSPPPNIPVAPNPRPRPKWITGSPTEAKPPEPCLDCDKGALAELIDKVTSSPTTATTPPFVGKSCQEYIHKGKLGRFGQILRDEILGTDSALSSHRASQFLNPAVSMADWCPNFERRVSGRPAMSDNEKVDFWIQFFVGLCFSESSCRANAANDGTATDLKAVGLFGLESTFSRRREIRGPGCNVPEEYDPFPTVNNAGEDKGSWMIANPKPNIACAVQIIGNHLCGSKAGFYTGQCDRASAPKDLNHTSHFHMFVFNQDPKFAKIRNWMRSYPPCTR